MRRQSVTTTYSRQSGHPKSSCRPRKECKQIYVQDVLREKIAGEVLSVLHQKEGHLYVCGGVNMAQGVTLAVQEILSSQLGPFGPTKDSEEVP
uniref:nitric-oxide synthase (NADPH) n=1 Tax=Hucho hucho TaxID=62062 RepID=A0A4W5NMF7_9TELE